MLVSYTTILNAQKTEKLYLEFKTIRPKKKFEQRRFGKNFKKVQKGPHPIAETMLRIYDEANINYGALICVYKKIAV